MAVFDHKPTIIRSHFSKSFTVGENLNLQLLFTTTRAASMKQCSLYSALHEAEPSTHVSYIEFPSQNKFCFIVGIVNGSVCLALPGTDLCLCNPVLNKIKHLKVYPEAPFTCEFGYDESNDDYKGCFDAEVSVYRLRADSWRRIDKLKCFRLCRHRLYANGKIFCSGCVSSTPKWKIVSLDMLSEKYGELQHPDYEPGDYALKLAVSGGRPVVLCDYKGRKADLWAMYKYGVEESWCRVVSIPYANVHPQMPYSHHLVLCILSNGEIVLENRLGLLVYNSKNKESWKIELDVGISSYIEVAAYVESLVWPNYA